MDYYTIDVLSFYHLVIASENNKHKYSITFVDSLSYKLHVIRQVVAVNRCKRARLVI